MYSADMNGYARLQNLPGDVTGKLAAHDAARAAAPRPGATSQEQRPPGFDDDRYNEQDGGAFVAWAQNKGHGSFDLRAARSDDAEPRTITSGGWELEDFRLDPDGRRLLYNGDDGHVAPAPDTGLHARQHGRAACGARVWQTG